MRPTPARPLAAIAVGLSLGIVTLAGLTATLPLSGPAAAAFGSAVPFAAPTSAAAPLSEIAADAEDDLAGARTAMASVTTVTAEIEASGLELGIDSTIATDDLRVSIERLSNTEVIPVLLLPALADDASAQARVVEQRVATLRAVLNGALAERAAEEAAARAAAEAQRQAEEAAAAAAALAQANTPDGAKATARQLAAERYGWGDAQFSCLASLWSKESGWDYQAFNASSGATGIPQSLPGSKMSTAGADWQTNAATQISWGLDYIDRAYGSPCAAWSHSQATNWY